MKEQDYIDYITAQTKKHQDAIAEIWKDARTNELSLINELCDYETGKVYELVENGHSNKQYTRFLIGDIEAMVVELEDKSKVCRIKAYCIWLDDEGNTTGSRYDEMYIHGIKNAAVFKLSENQNFVEPEKSEGEVESDQKN